MKMDNLVTRLPEYLRDEDIQEYINEYYRNEGKESYPSIALPRWRRETHYPPVDVLVGMARIKGTNVSYILGMTDISAPNEYSVPRCEHTLSELLELCRMSEKDLMTEWTGDSVRNSYKTLHQLKTRLPFKRLQSLVRLSNALGLSVDFILGYTDYATWEMWHQMNVDPFGALPAGAGAYVIADRTVRTSADAEDAVIRGDGSFCVVSSDRRSVFFPNGNRLSVDDELFKGVYVARVVPEVRSL